MKYKIIKDADPVIVESAVNDLLEKGWSLHGVLICPQEFQKFGGIAANVPLYVQAMIYSTEVKK